MGDAVRPQGDFSVFFGEEMNFIFSGFQADGAEDLLLFKKSNDSSDLHECSFLAFSRARNKAGGTTLTRLNLS